MKRGRAMTLLEVVLAVAVLAAMSALLAAMWRQTARWAEDGASGQRAMRLARVMEMLRWQWGDRRTSAALRAGGAAVAVDTAALTFVSASSILESGWPLVRARYVIERDYRSSVGNESAWRLVYEELPLVDLERAAGVPGESIEAGGRVAERLEGSPPERRHVLLAGCGALRWERYGLSAAVEREGAPGAAEGAESGAARVGRSHSREDLTLMWREVEEGFIGRVPAVRLAGRCEGEEFACVFVVEDSR